MQGLQSHRSHVTASDHLSLTYKLWLPVCPSVGWVGCLSVSTLQNENRLTEEGGSGGFQQSCLYVAHGHWSKYAGRSSLAH